jgi:hypothetical protein
LMGPRSESPFGDNSSALLAATTTVFPENGATSRPAIWEVDIHGKISKVAKIEKGTFITDS